MVSLGFEVRIIFSAARRNTCDEFLIRKLSAESAQHLTVELIAQFENVARIRIEYENKLHAEMIAAGDHPAHAFGEAFPVWLLILEWQ